LIEVPSPSTSRPPLTRSRSIAVIAISNGLLAKALTMPLASCTRSVTAAQ
jgi:hypothetical protein